MPKKPPHADAIVTARLPMICPACADPHPAPTRESGGVTRLTCLVCSWTERYLVTA